MRHFMLQDRCEAAEPVYGCSQYDGALPTSWTSPTSGESFPLKGRGDNSTSANECLQEAPVRSRVRARSPCSPWTRCSRTTPPWTWRPVGRWWCPWARRLVERVVDISRYSIVHIADADIWQLLFILHGSVSTEWSKHKLLHCLWRLGNWDGEIGERIHRIFLPHFHLDISNFYADNFDSLLDVRR